MPAKDNRNFLSFNRIIMIITIIIIIIIIIAIFYIIVYLINIVFFLLTIHRSLWIIISDPTCSLVNLGVYIIEEI